MFFWWSSTKTVQAIWIRQKTWPPGRAGLIFLIYLYGKLKKSSCQKPTDRFQYYFAEVFLWWFSTKIVQAIWILQKNMAARERGLFSLYIYIENLRNLLFRNHWTDCYIILQKSSFGDSGAGLIFSIYTESLKKSSCQKPLDWFQYNLADMFPWWPFTKIVQAVMICQKTWLQGGRSYFP